VFDSHQADSSLLRLRYIAHADGDSDTKCATMLLVTNLGSPGGIAMASALIDFVQQGTLFCSTLSFVPKLS
jgi:hypothetical protein